MCLKLQEKEHSIWSLTRPSPPVATATVAVAVAVPLRVCVCVCVRLNYLWHEREQTPQLAGHAAVAHEQTEALRQQYKHQFKTDPFEAAERQERAAERRLLLKQMRDHAPPQAVAAPAPAPLAAAAPALAAPAPAATSIFGAAPAPAAGGLFGATPAPAPAAGGFGFGAPAAAPAPAATGFGFGAPAAAAPAPATTGIYARRFGLSYDRGKHQRIKYRRSLHPSSIGAGMGIMAYAATLHLRGACTSFRNNAATYKDRRRPSTKVLEAYHDPSRLCGILLVFSCTACSLSAFETKAQQLFSSFLCRQGSGLGRRRQPLPPPPRPGASSALPPPRASAPRRRRRRAGCSGRRHPLPPWARSSLGRPRSGRRLPRPPRLPRPRRQQQQPRRRTRDGTGEVTTRGRPLGGRLWFFLPLSVLLLCCVVLCCFFFV